ncbi:SRPBCC family protein [Streptomyces sp. NBC_00555]|uniref:SRPBCC family protein n=1 Tax=Streptomyces sp. NBC_00555 TaxID=2903662 RepID=UPI002254C6F0|nr:SRPBCC family protein [Streptomyces sp. NBC_00555]MCX5010485.1 SRPBCC family protein [Streptomyces sp. NBC_00555]
MPIDVTAERVIPIPPGRVAAYAMDWRHDAAWTQGIREAALTREADTGGFGVGAEVTRTAYFLGKRIDYVLRYVLRVIAHEPPELLDMASVAGPMPMHVTYTFAPHPGGTLARIRIRIRVRGEAGGFYRLAAPAMARKVRSSLVQDLRDLERRLLG